MASQVSDLSHGKCFVIQPFDEGEKFDKRYCDTFKPAIEAAGLAAYRVDKDPEVDNLIEEIEKGIAESCMCFAEITLDNPNVWYELGFARALGKPTCLVCSEEPEGSYPFDIHRCHIIKYKVASSSDFDELAQKITEKVQALIQGQKTARVASQLEPTTKTKGLKPHEVAVLALVMSQRDSNWLGPGQLQNEMQKAGFTDIATAIAVEKLKRAKMLDSVSVEDHNGELYNSLFSTEKGKDWLLQNEDSLDLRAPRVPDDIPF